jgi:hypothetical protein
MSLSLWLSRLLKNAHLLRSARPSPALHLDIFDQPAQKPVFH